MSSINYSINKDLEITHEADVIVIGGGPGGLGAAVMAARAGAKTLLIERYGCLGGMAAYGEVHPFMPNHKGNDPINDNLDKPVFTEWRDRIISYYSKETRENMTITKCPPVDKTTSSLAAEDLCLEAGVELLFHHTLADVICNGNDIEALVLFSKSGLSAAKAKVYIDCSGDGDLAARAGCEFEFGGEGGYCQPMTTCFKLKHVDRSRMPEREAITDLYNKAKERGDITCPRGDVLWFTTPDDDVIHFNTTRIVMKSGVNGCELSDAEIEGRRQVRDYLNFLRKEIPGFEKAELLSMASHVGIRETRRIKGRGWLTRQDFIDRSKFDDAIARVWYPIDIHSTTGADTELVHMKNGEWYEIPYGCIVAKDKDNLLIGGRPISVDHAIHSSMRVMPPAVTVGSAAGMAAAMSVKSGKKPYELEGVEVRKNLVEQGAFL